jgi:hypothetical protein
VEIVKHLVARGDAPNLGHLIATGDALGLSDDDTYFERLEYHVQWLAVAGK